MSDLIKVSSLVTNLCRMTIKDDTEAIEAAAKLRDMITEGPMRELAVETASLLGNYDFSGALPVINQMSDEVAARRGANVL